MGIRSSAGYFSYICRLTGDYIFHYKETCEVLLDYPKIGGESIKDFVRNSIRNILHENIDVYGRILISKFSGDGVKCIEKFSHIVPT